MPGPQVCVGGCLRVVARGMAVGGRFRGASGTPPLRFAREWAAAGASPSSGPAGPPSPKGEGKGCCWRRRKVSRGVGDAAPCGLPGNGRQRGPAPHPALRGHLPPRGKARAVVEGFIPPGVLAQSFAGRRGRRALRLARERAAAGACPSSGPAGPPSPEGEGKGCCWRQREVAAGWGHPALRMGIWKRPRGLRGHPFPGRRTVGAGHARPGGVTQAPVNGSVRREGS